MYVLRFIVIKRHISLTLVKKNFLKFQPPSLGGERRYSSYCRTVFSLSAMILSIDANVESFNACSKFTKSAGSGRTEDGWACIAVDGNVREMHLKERVS